MKYALLSFLCFLHLAFAEKEPSQSVIPEELVASMDLPTTSLSPSEELLTYPMAPPEPIKEDVHILLYGQMETIFPGGGVAFRAYNNKKVGLELNTGLYIVGLKASISMLVAFADSVEDRWYLGLGGGGTTNLYTLFMSKHTVVPYANAFIGYEKKTFFSDLGVDLVFGTSTPIPPLPVLRVGARF